MVDFSSVGFDTMEDLRYEFFNLKNTVLGDFFVTFELFASMWIESEKFDQRGDGLQDFKFLRINANSPWESGNVAIMTPSVAYGHGVYGVEKGEKVTNTRKNAHNKQRVTQWKPSKKKKQRNRLSVAVVTPRGNQLKFQCLHMAATAMNLDTTQLMRAIDSGRNEIHGYKVVYDDNYALAS